MREAQPPGGKGSSKMLDQTGSYIGVYPMKGLPLAPRPIPPAAFIASNSNYSQLLMRLLLHYC